MGNRLTILIVDDVTINREILKDIFKSEYRVIEAEDGLSALEALRSGNQIDIILLDIIMPKMNGLEFLQIIKNDARLKNIPVIVNTQEGEKAKEFKALELGADDFIVKPYNPKVVKQRVTNIVRKYINEKESMERKIQDTMNRLKSLIDTVPGGIGIFEVSDILKMEFFNDGLCKLLDYTREELSKYRNKNALDFIVKEDRLVLIEEGRKCQGDGLIHCKVRFKMKNDSIKWVGITAKRMNSELNRKVYHAVFMDLSEEKAAEERLQDSMSELRYRAEHDNLTGIFNRETFYRETEKMIRENPDKMFVIGHWNIDRFKVVNELMGSKTADAALCDFAQRLDKKLKGRGTYGRLEADHFVTCTTREVVELEMDHVERVLSGDTSWKHLKYPIRMHVGLYLVEDRNTPIELMCDRAGMALQIIKNNYLKRWNYYNDNIKENILNEEELVNEMENALAQRQFEVYIQPIYDADTRRPVSAEALVRWKHPVKGMIAPDLFIPLFEKNGFITKLDMYVWEEVCRYLSERQEQGKNLIPISVNLSRINFYNPNLPEDISSLVKRYGIKPRYLKLEITESAYKDNPDELLSAMKVLQEKGFKVLMDDFGSGYSSLNMLKDVPVDILKIDMKFIDDLEASDRACNILYSIIQMAKGLKMSVIAEGVETQSQYELLLGMGCDSIQGYYFSRPLSEEDFTKEIDQEIEKTFDYEIFGEKKQTILVVDDMEINRISIFEIIKDKYRVIEASNGEDALKILKREFANINLVISDIFMPEKNGFELLEIMKKNDLLRTIPVLVLTAFGEPKNETRALELGALDVITKPYDPETLKKRIENLLQISESDSIKAEVQALRKSAAVRKQVQSMLRNDVASICRIQIGYENLEVKRLVFANEKFMELHQLGSLNRREVKSLYAFRENIVSEDQDKLINRMIYAIKKRETSWQNIYRIEGSDGNIHHIISNCMLDFQPDGIMFDTIELEMVLKENFQFEKSLESFIDTIAHDMNLSIWVYSIENDSVDYAAKKIDGRQRRIMQKRHLMELKSYLDKEDRPRLESMHEKLRQNKKRVSEEFCIMQWEQNAEIRKEHWVRITYSRIEGDQPDKRIALGICEDITEQRKYQIRQWREQQYQEIFSRDAFFFAEVDLTDNCFLSEKVQEGGFGWQHGCRISYDDFIEERLEKLVMNEDIKYVDSLMRRTNLKKWYAQGEREVNFDVRIMLPHTDTYEWHTSTLYMVKDPSNKHICASWKIRNTEEEKKKLGKIRQMAERDSLTELYNRITFEKNVEKAFMKSNPQNKLSAFIMIDVDNFKQVNDSFGHDFGDIVLKAVAKILKTTFRKEDMIGRLGGDEFAVFIPRATSKRSILERVQEACQKVCTTFENKGEKVSISCSIGVVYAPEEGQEFQVLYEKADDALYMAKNAGKNQYIVYGK